MRLSGKALTPLILLALSSFAHAAPGAFRITSPDFAEGALIPSRFTCEGENVSPAIEIAGVPDRAVSLALVVDDPDAPSGTFTHWLGWNILPRTVGLARWSRRPSTAPDSMVQGTNDFGVAGYSGPCPPSGTHRYFFRLYALDTKLSLAAGASRKDFDNAIRGHVIGTAILMGRYAKTGSR